MNTLKTKVWSKAKIIVQEDFVAQKTGSPFSVYELFYVLVFSIFLFSLIYKSPVQRSNFYIFSDPLINLLVSQSVLDYGTIRLDNYTQSVLINSNDFRLIEHNNHLYYFFPLGYSVFSIPFVWAANLMGKSMTLISSDIWLQSILSTLTVISCFIIGYFIARHFITQYWSLFFSLTFVLGSSIISTMGTALWSINYEVIFILLGILILINYNKIRKSIFPYILAATLFSAYFCRPTAATFIISAGIYLFIKDRNSFIKATFSFIILFCFFVFFSLTELHQILPVYYFPERVAHARVFFTALYGHLLSPSRGILIYSPHILVTLVLVLIFFKKLKLWINPFIWISLIWFSLHLFINSNFLEWWGGWSYGNRLFTDVMPAFFLLIVIFWKYALISLNKIKINYIFSVFFVAATVAVFINTYQGLYNVSTAYWNIRPSIDKNQKYLFDWRFPQFLSTQDMLERKMEIQGIAY